MLIVISGLYILTLYRRGALSKNHAQFYVSNVVPACTLLKEKLAHQKQIEQHSQGKTKSTLAITCYTNC